MPTDQFIIQRRLLTFVQRIEEIIQEYGGEIPLSLKIDIKQPTIDRWRHAIQYPRLKELIKLTSALNVSADYLIGANMVGGLDFERLRSIALESAKGKSWGLLTPEERLLFIGSIYTRYPAGEIDYIRVRELLETVVRQGKASIRLLTKESGKC